MSFSLYKPAQVPPPRRIGRYIALLFLVVILAGGWCVFWYYAAGKAEAMIEGWRVREAKSGRVVHVARAVAAHEWLQHVGLVCIPNARAVVLDVDGDAFFGCAQANGGLAAEAYRVFHEIGDAAM